MKQQLVEVLETRHIFKIKKLQSDNQVQVTEIYIGSFVERPPKCACRLNEKFYGESIYVFPQLIIKYAFTQGYYNQLRTFYELMIHVVSRFMMLF